jgi:hypothetical protein
MTDHRPAPLRDLTANGFAHVPAEMMRARLAALGFGDWQSFAESWNDLGTDRYMADGGRYRKRRHAALSIAAASGEFRVKPHQPHYQSRDYNTLNGGIARWFKHMLPQTLEHPALKAILREATAIFTAATEAKCRPNFWHVELHQFRIETAPGMEGRPTPEGMHRDGVDFVSVTLIRRENVASGMTTIHDDTRQCVGAFTLTETLETALVDDSRVYHGVTPVQPIDPAHPAYRDVLVATFRRE